MGDVKSVTELLVEQLRQKLPMADDKAITDVVKIITGVPASRSMDQVAASLLHSNVSTGTILGALLQCEWMNMQELTSRLEHEKEKISLQHYSHIINHFNDLQASVIRATDNQWHKTIFANKQKAKIIEENRNLWVSQGKLQLHNYFYEIPVSATARVIRLEDDYIWIQMSSEVIRVLSVVDDGKTALISSLDNSYNLVVGVSCLGNGEISITIRDVILALREQRHDVRIAPTEEIPVHVKREGKEFIAKVSDISCSGMRLTLHAGAGVSEGDHLLCNWKLNDIPFETGGRVSWLKKNEGQLLIGIKLELERSQRSDIYRYLFGQQQAIAERLRNLGQPYWLRDGHL